MSPIFDFLGLNNEAKARNLLSSEGRCQPIGEAAKKFITLGTDVVDMLKEFVKSHEHGDEYTPYQRRYLSSALALAVLDAGDGPQIITHCIGFHIDRLRPNMFDNKPPADPNVLVEALDAFKILVDTSSIQRYIELAKGLPGTRPFSYESKNICTILLAFESNRATEALHILLMDSAQAGEDQIGMFLDCLDTLDQINDSSLGSKLGEIASSSPEPRRDKFYLILARHPSAKAINHVCNLLDKEYNKYVQGKKYYDWILSANINNAQEYMHALSSCAALGSIEEKTQAAKIFVRYLSIPNCTIRRSVVEGILQLGKMVIPHLECAKDKPDDIWCGNHYLAKVDFEHGMRENKFFGWEGIEKADRMIKWMKIMPIEATEMLLAELR